MTDALLVALALAAASEAVATMPPLYASGAVAQRTRHVLAHVCSSAGLINYAYEWWHWSYGDPYWAVMTAQDAAVYDAIELSCAGQV